MKHDPADPEWPDRDRFVLSNGHASILQYTLLYLSGYGLELDDLKQFRQFESATPGHPEARHTPGVEVTTGPLGQGFGDAVGMAIAERYLRARFGREAIDHHTFVIAGDGCMMEGISHEAASLAGHLGLGRLICVYDDNRITIDGPTSLAFSDDTAGRFAAYGWDVSVPRRDGQRPRRAHGGDPGGQGRRQPTPHVGPPQPHRVPVPRPHRRLRGARPGVRRRRREPHQGRDGDSRRAVLVAARARRRVPEPCRHGRCDGPQGVDGAQRDGRRHARVAGGVERDRCPGWTDDLPTFELGTSKATRQAIQAAFDATVDSLPGLVAGAADLTGNTGTKLAGQAQQTAEEPGGRQIRYGVREHGMGAALVGMAMHGGILPVGGTFFVFADYMRPPIRLAALSRAKAVLRASRTTRSASARTGRPTNPSNRSPRSARSPVCR